MSILLLIVGTIVLTVLCLKWFDRLAGRGPKQVSDGIKSANRDERRIPCPMCAEKILPAAKICPFCKSNIKV
ncbi:MAG: hypothetical protein HQK55_17760 [Deltaproteobacteria bacterium]|nr:hypothetical protein [Deltaproteobacteria bacterium]